VNLAGDAVIPDEEFKRRRRGRSVAIALALAVLVSLFYALTLVKLAQGPLTQPIPLNQPIK
jgi:hypothetical protein